MATNSHTHPPADHRLTVDIPDRIFDIDAAIVAESNDRIRNDPAGLVISVRDAYAGRVPYVYNKYLLSLMDCFMEARFESKSFGIDMPLPLGNPSSPRGWLSCGRKWPARPTFLPSTRSHFVELTLVGLSQMIMIITDPRYGAPSPASRRTLLRNAPSMFRSFWEHRELIPHTGTPGVGLGYDTAIYELISQAVNGFMTLYEKYGDAPILYRRGSPSPQSRS
ncbi:hypothetical protein OF83DRAFT_1125056 [Amylostereum chailletii]|nr:hypothetical protein OF83DRAFT_1125056 [Amylostereum chailletii]